MKILALEMAGAQGEGQADKEIWRHRPDFPRCLLGSLMEQLRETSFRFASLRFEPAHLSARVRLRVFYFGIDYLNETFRISNSFVGGTARIRTGDRGFAVLGLTTWRRCLFRAMIIHVVTLTGDNLSFLLN